MPVRKAIPTLDHNPSSPRCLFVEGARGAVSSGNFLPIYLGACNPTNGKPRAEKRAIASKLPDSQPARKTDRQQPGGQADKQDKTISYKRKRRQANTNKTQTSQKTTTRARCRRPACRTRKSAFSPPTMMVWAAAAMKPAALGCSVSGFLWEKQADAGGP